MELSAIFTSVGINSAVCVGCLSLYSILRQQPSNFSVYFGRKIAQANLKANQSIRFQRFVPSPSWMVKAWATPESEILAYAGVDAVVFLRIIVFSLRIFAVAAFVAVVLVLPVNYYGRAMHHKQIPRESLDVFTVGNIKEGSKWLWAHCLAMYIITCTACMLLYFEYKHIAKLRLSHIRTSPPNPSHFSVLVRGIPWSPNQSYSDTVKNFFTKYHGTSYLGHQMVYRCGTVQELMAETEKMCTTLTPESFRPNVSMLGLCSGPIPSGEFRILPEEPESSSGKPPFHDLATATNAKEVPAAFVFFKTRYAADIAAEVFLSTNPMSWVTDYAPEPHDVYWSNLCIPYGQIWFRRLASLLAAISFSIAFIVPVACVQALVKLNKLHDSFPFLRGLLEKKYMSQLVTGYLPSVILLLFLYTVPPTMMMLAVMEGCISRSGRKKSACRKVLYFMIWNVFFVNVLSDNILDALNRHLSSPRELPTNLARNVPAQAHFFMTYVVTSGWASLSIELMQPVMLIWNWYRKGFLGKTDDLTAFAFPYHTEVPRILVLGFLGFTFSIVQPLILPLLLIYFFLGFLVYRNQILNVYMTKYESGGQLWPTVHSATIFSLVFMQVIALCVFGLKQSRSALSWTAPLIIFTILFNEYCRQRFYPIFKNTSAEVLIEMDREDEQSGRMEDIHRDLQNAYCQFTLLQSEMAGKSARLSPPNTKGQSTEAPINMNPAFVAHPDV